MLEDKEALLRVVLPDPEADEMVDVLAARFELDPDRAKQEIEEARSFFRHRKDRAKGTVEIYYSKIIPVFSFYRFNNKAVVALYNHREGRIPVPTFVCNKDGFLFKHITDEFEGIIAATEKTRRVDT